MDDNNEWMATWECRDSDIPLASDIMFESRWIFWNIYSKTPVMDDELLYQIGDTIRPILNKDDLDTVYTTQDKPDCEYNWHYGSDLESEDDTADDTADDTNEDTNEETNTE